MQLAKFQFWILDNSFIKLSHYSYLSIVFWNCPVHSFRRLSIFFKPGKVHYSITTLSLRLLFMIFVQYPWYYFWAVRLNRKRQPIIVKCKSSAQHAYLFDWNCWLIWPLARMHCSNDCTHASVDWFFLMRIAVALSDGYARVQTIIT